MLEVDYVLTTNLPSNPPTTTPTPFNLESSTGPFATVADQVKKDQVIDPEKHAKDNKTVLGHLLNHMSDLMFDLFVAQKSAKDIWSTLKSQYGGDDAGQKEYVVGKDRTKQDKGHKEENSKKRQFKALGGQIKKNKLKPTPQAKLAEQDDEVIATIVEINLKENKIDWILDTKASRHFCTNRELLHDYEDTTDGECVFMGNLATAGVIGKGKGLRLYWKVTRLSSPKMENFSLRGICLVVSLYSTLFP
ncbi:ty1-copia retrotransposon protein [Cucumis melo var. makuwa]|uniref:Ty1-copia retrotransposon protein n=1 Tax=Cucumis melo var. makuwa TaxID=1194695 RepID=A0A5D3CQM8_CUCMM|nr:ty1-copia retrotransposon protein [Cucumis melo var. makuwa]